MSKTERLARELFEIGTNGYAEIKPEPRKPEWSSDVAFNQPIRHGWFAIARHVEKLLREKAKQYEP